MDFGEANFAGYIERVGEIGIGFAGEADNDVGGEGRAVERFFDQLAAVDDSLGTPAAVHAAKDFV